MMARRPTSRIAACKGGKHVLIRIEDTASPGWISPSLGPASQDIVSTGGSIPSASHWTSRQSSFEATGVQPHS